MSETLETIGELLTVLGDLPPAMKIRVGDEDHWDAIGRNISIHHPFGVPIACMHPVPVEQGGDQ